MKNKLTLTTIMKLKIPLLLLLFLAQSFIAKAQNTENESIRALKVVFITEQLDLSPKEAEKFWPLYNMYTAKEYNLKFHETRKLRNQILSSGGVDAISDNEADLVLKKLIDIENEIAAVRNEMYVKLKSIISSKKLIKLQIAEVEFNKKVLEELRKKRLERYRKN